jgi:hypothetical protein
VLLPAWELGNVTDCPTRLLEIAATDHESSTRTVVASNQTCPLDALEQLSRDHSSSVRSGVAGNPSTPHETLERLLLDRQSAVRDAVLTNPRAADLLAMWQLVHGRE